MYLLVTSADSIQARDDAFEIRSMTQMLLTPKASRTLWSSRPEWKMCFILKHPMNASPAWSTLDCIISFCDSANGVSRALWLGRMVLLLCIFPALEVQHELHSNVILNMQVAFQMFHQWDLKSLRGALTQQNQSRWRLGFRVLGH